MIASAFAALAASASAQMIWHCRNPVENRCDAESCVATPLGEFTPLDIWADTKKGATVCAYTGCWETRGKARTLNGRRIWTADAAPFSTAEYATSDVMLVVSEKDGDGFVRVAGIAAPLLCARAAQASADR